MRKKLSALLALLILLIPSQPGRADGYRIQQENEESFGQLLCHLYTAYTAPAPEDMEKIAADMEAIRAVSGADGEVARSIADHWERVYLDPAYELVLYGGESPAQGLEDSGIENSPAHAFVVLGYELKNGKMTGELTGRCRAAAAAADAYPETILVCSGGATGANNPKNRTEAGLMKDYLVRKCGIGESRIFIDEQAKTTLENAVNTFRILEEQGVRTITVVTSSYHQRWGQAVYNAMAAICRQSGGPDIEIVGNYSFEMQPQRIFRDDASWAVQQLATLLQLPSSALEEILED